MFGLSSPPAWQAPWGRSVVYLPPPARRLTAPPPLDRGPQAHGDAAVVLGLAAPVQAGVRLHRVDVPPEALERVDILQGAPTARREEAVDGLDAQRHDVRLVHAQPG